MKLREKNKEGAEPVSMDWDQAQAALQTDNYEIVEEGSDVRGPDQPAAQTPAPGTEPAGTEPAGEASEGE